jgi:hypothetical protein
MPDPAPCISNRRRHLPTPLQILCGSILLVHSDSYHIDSSSPFSRAHALRMNENTGENVKENSNEDIEEKWEKLNFDGKVWESQKKTNKNSQKDGNFDSDSGDSNDQPDALDDPNTGLDLDEAADMMERTEELVKKLPSCLSNEKGLQHTRDVAAKVVSTARKMDPFKNQEIRNWRVDDLLEVYHNPPRFSIDTAVEMVEKSQEKKEQKRERKETKFRKFVEKEYEKLEEAEIVDDYKKNFEELKLEEVHQVQVECREAEENVLKSKWAKLQQNRIERLNGNLSRFLHVQMY